MIYSIRQATLDDSAEIAATHVASWQTAYRGLLPDELLDDLSVEQRRAHWSKYLSNPRPRTETLVAMNDRAVVGFATIGPRRCEQPTKSDGELYAIYLHPDHWGHCAGHRLHEQALKRLHEHGFTTATLWVLAGNARAVKFYQRAGWHTNGVRRIDVRPDGTERPEVQMEHPLSLR